MRYGLKFHGWSINSSMINIGIHSMLIDIDIHGMFIFLLSPRIMFYSDHIWFFFASSNIQALPNISAMRTYATAPLLCSCMAWSEDNLPSFTFPHFLQALNSEIHMAKYSKNGIALVTESNKEVMSLYNSTKPYQVQTST